MSNDPNDFPGVAPVAPPPMASPPGPSAPAPISAPLSSDVPPPAAAPPGAWAHPPGGPAPPPNLGAQPSGGGCGKVIAIIAAVCLFGLGALIAIGTMLPGTGDITVTDASVDERSQGAFVNFTMVVNELPESESVDPTSLSVRVESIAIQGGSVDFDWDVIALKDDRPESNPGEAPPVGAEMRVSLLIEPNLVPEVTIYEGDGVWLHVEALYGGKRKDKYSIDISDLYGL